MNKPHLTLYRSIPMSSGRPLKFGERLIRREFRFPESLSERLNRVARNRGLDVSDIARGALIRELDEIEGLRDTEVKDAVREAFEDIVSARIFVSFNNEDRREVESVARQMAFTDASHMAKEFLLEALTNPERAREFLFGKSRPHVKSDKSDANQDIAA